MLASLTEAKVFDIVLGSPEPLRHILIVDVQFRQLSLVDDYSDQILNSGGFVPSLSECSVKA